MKHFDTFGVMLDCSRNAVMTVKELKHFITVLARMGYNQLQLYIEDTYEVDNEPYFGSFRGRYSQDELREIDQFAFDNGVELVPCMQTLAHLNTLKYWPQYEKMMDAQDVLMVGEERTYELIENMISSLRKCVRTNKIHIGMDEAHMLGKGRYRDKHGDRDRSEILLEHLGRVCEITKKYDFEPMMWSDMFYRIANNGHYYAKEDTVNASIGEKIPESVSLVYWDYYRVKKADYRQMIRGHKRLTDRVVFAGGAWKWMGFTPKNAFSLRATKAAFSACIEEGIRDVFMTMWGDNGAEASAWSTLPTLCYAACLAQGITKMDDIKAKFEEWIGYRYDDFMLLDLPDRLNGNKGRINPSKYELYNDCFFGLLDSAVGENDAKQYASFAKRLRNASKRTGEFSYLFDTASKLCAVLAYKSDIGIRTREMYASGDPEALEPIIADYNKMIKRTEAFYQAFRAQWYTENKANGFEVHDIRLGGLIMRMKNCRDRLADYVAGRIDEIPELHEQTMPFRQGHTDYNYYYSTVTRNLL